MKSSSTNLTGGLLLAASLVFYSLWIPSYLLLLLADLIAYKRIDDAERRAVADELTAEAQRLGLDY